MDADNDEGAAGCPERGKEAEELRRGIESLIDGTTVPTYRLQELLDAVDARDSLAYLEDAPSRAVAASGPSNFELHVYRLRNEDAPQWGARIEADGKRSRTRFPYTVPWRAAMVAFTLWIVEWRGGK